MDAYDSSPEKIFEFPPIDVGPPRRARRKTPWCPKTSYHRSYRPVVTLFGILPNLALLLPLLVTLLVNPGAAIVLGILVFLNLAQFRYPGRWPGNFWLALLGNTGLILASFWYWKVSLGESEEVVIYVLSIFLEAFAYFSLIALVWSRLASKPQLTFDLRQLAGFVVYVSVFLAVSRSLLGLSDYHFFQEQRTAAAHFEGLGAITEWNRWQVRSLNLWNSAITDQDLEFLPQLPAVRSLVLGHATMSDAAMVHVGELKNLQELCLYEVAVSDAGMESLSGLHHLEDLELNDTNVTDQGLVHLRQMPHLWRLSLNGSKNVRDAGLVHLQSLQSLTHLNLRSTNVTDRGLAYVGGIKQLEHLNLTDTPITDAGLFKLSQMQHLRVLVLTGTNITDDGLVALRNLPELHSLDLSETIVSGHGVRHLAGLGGLRQLCLGKFVSSIAIERLRQQLPECAINRRFGDVY